MHNERAHSANAVCTCGRQNGVDPWRAGVTYPASGFDMTLKVRLCVASVFHASAVETSWRKAGCTAGLLARPLLAASNAPSHMTICACGELAIL